MVKIDYRDARPIYEQVADGIEELALRGALPADTQLPSVRQFAMELSINPNTIQRAYGELERRGVIYAAKGRGNFFGDERKEARYMVKIDYRDARPIYEQVADGIEELALRGALPADTQLPSVRQFAMELSINPNTIQRAYGELERRGVIYAAKGRGNFVSDVGTRRDERLREVGAEISALASKARSLGADEAQLIAWVTQKGEDGK